MSSGWFASNAGFARAATIVALASIVVALPASEAGAQRSRGDTTILPPVTVTATRVDSAPSNRVWSSSVLTADDLRRRGIVSLGDALRLVPGAAVVQSGSPGAETALFMRGGERDFVLFLLDGVPLNEPGGFINLAFVPIDNIDRIEIVRGPASVLYGSDAISAVVQIFTKKATKDRHSDISSAWGSRGTRNSDLSVSAMTPGSNYSIGAAQNRTKGVYDLNNRSRNNSYGGAAAMNLSGTSKLELNGRLTDGRYNYPTSFYGAPLDSNSYNSERRLSAGAGVTTHLSKTVDAAVDASYMRQKVVLADPADALTPFPFDSRILTERRSAGARLNWRGGGATVVTGGVQYELQDNTTEGVDSPDQNPLLERWIHSAFAQLLASDRKIDLTLGARLDDNQRFGSFFTWRAATGAPIGRFFHVRGAIGTAFREPQFSELTGGGFAKPNPALDPERTQSWEIAFESTLLRSRAFLSATYFHQTFFDLIRYADLTGDPDYFNQYQNIDRAGASGWELEVRTHLTEELRLSSNFTLLDARVEGSGPNAGDMLPRRPSRYGSASVSWRPAPKFTLGSDLSYVGRRSDTRYFADFTSQPERLPGYAKVDFTGELVFQSNPSEYPLTITARVDNAFNRKYEAVAGFASPGRRFVIGARLMLVY